jgi:hypothetical protein
MDWWRPLTGVGTTNGSGIDWEALSWWATLGAVFLSLLVVPRGLTYYFATVGPPASDGALAMLIGLVALVPGFLMGAAGLWVCARG